MNKLLKKFLTGSLVLLGLTAQADVEVFKSIVNDLTEVDAGQTFAYKLQYRAASTTTDFFGATLTDPLPAGLEFVSLNGTIHVDSFNYNAAGNELTINFIDPLPAGSTGDIEVNVRFKKGETPDGTVAVNTAAAQADNSPLFVSDPVSITARAENKATVTKDLLGTSIPLDQNVTYRVRVLNTNPTGSLNLSDVVLVDTLPAGAEFVDASHGGVYDGVANTVTWPSASLNVGNTLTRTVTVKFPEPVFGLGDTVINEVVGTYTPLGETEVTDTAATTHTIVAPQGKHNFWKSVSNNYVYEGKEAFKTWTFELRNEGNVPMENVVITDVIPKELDLTRIRTGRTSGTPDGLQDPIDVFYKTNLNGSWQALPGNSYPGNSSSWVNVSSLGLGGSEYVTEVKWDFGTLPVGYRIQDTQINTTVMTTDRDGNPVVTGQEILNDGMLVYNDYRGTITDNDDDDIDVRSPRPVVRLSKGASPSTVDDGGQTTYTVALKNDGLAARDLENPVLADLLDAKLVYVPGSYTIVNKPSGAPDPIFTVTNDYNGTGRTLLKWAWEGAAAYDLPINQEVKIEFKADIPAGTIYGNIGNDIVLIDFDNPVVDRISTGEITDTLDLDNDGNTTEKHPATSRSITVRGRVSMDSVKWVRGELDADWTKFPDSGNTVPGGMADYRIIVKNTGNVPIHDTVILDILPVIGDTGVIDLSQRDTEWVASLAGPVTAPPGVSVYYSRSSDPKRLDFDPTGPAGSEDPLWSSTPPATIIEARSLLFVFDSVVIQPNQEFEISWPMRAPVETPTNQEIAWNSFGFYGTREDTNTLLLPSEPIKVGIKVNPDNNAGYGDFVWLDANKDGIQDPGEIGLNGIPVRLYQDSGPSGFPDGIKNEFDILVGFTVTSNDFFGEPGYYLFPNLDNQGLDRGDYYAVFDIPDAYTVSPMDQGSDDSKDSDVDPVDGSTAITTLDAGELDRTWDLGLSLPPYSVSIVKTAGTAADGDVYWTKPGTPVTYTYVVTNTSPDLPLVRLTVTDDKLGLVDMIDGPIEPGESITVTKTSGNLSDGVINIGDVIGYPADATTKLEIAGAPPVTDDDPAEVKLYAAIGDFVWIDTNLDGIQDNGEPKVSGVTVTLYDASGTPIDTTTTNGQGKYLFDELFPGDYSVGFTAPAGTVFTKQDEGANDAKDSDADPATGRTVVTTLDEGEKDLTWDAGLIEVASLGDYVWWDYNADGIQDASEEGLNGVTVNLLDGAGAPVLDGSGDPITTVTANGPGGAGYYIFSGLTPGIPYRVEFVPAAGMEFTLQDADANGINGAKNSDADPTTGITAAVVLANGEHNPNIDAGIKSDPKIALIKAVDKTEYSVDGETLTYSFTVTNTGNVPLSNVMVTDPLFPVQGGPISLAVGEVDSTTFTGTYNVTLADLNAGNRPNVAKVVGTFDATGEVVEDTDDVTVPALQLPELALEKTGEIRIGTSGHCPALGPLANFNALILGDFAAVGGDTDGRLAVGGNASIPSSYSVGIPVKGDPIPPIIGSDTDMFIVGGDLEDGVWGVNGNVVFGGTRTGPFRYQNNGNVMRQVIPVTFDANGNVPDDGSGTTFEELEEYMEAAAALYGSLDDRGVVTVDDTQPYALTLEGNDPVLNIFNLTAAQWSNVSTLYTITAPPGSTVLINVHGSPINIVNGGMEVNGVSFRNILYNYVDATEVSTSGFTLMGSVLAPYADGTFSGGGIDGTAIFGGNVSSSNGFEFHNFPFEGSICVEVLYEFTVANVGNVTITDITIDDPQVTVIGGPIPTMDPGESDGTTFTAVYNLKPEDIVNGKFKNTAVASGQPPFGPRVSNSDSHKLTFTIPGIGSTGFAGAGGAGGSGGSGSGVVPPPGPPADAWKKADFVITFKEFKGLKPQSGDKFKAVVEVTNEGDLAGDAGTLKAWLDKLNLAVPGEPGDVEISIGTLDPGETRRMVLSNLEVPALTDPDGHQTFTFRAYVDAAPTEEYSIGNQQVSATYDVHDTSTSTPDWMKADFVVTSVQLKPSPTVMGTRFDAVIRVTNEGDLDGDAGTLKLWEASPSWSTLSLTPDHTQAMGEIKAGKTRKFTFTDLEAPNVEGTFHTRVIVDTVTPEYSVGNNQGGATYTVFPLKIKVKNLANGDNQLTWKSAAGFTYTVERSNSPAGPYLPIAVGVGSTPPKNTFVDDAVPPGIVFYRVWGSR